MRYSLQTPDRVFYEGRWTQTDSRRVSLRSFLIKKNRFFMAAWRHLKPALVLDMGCGGGWRFLSARSICVGIDLSVRSLANAKGIYDIAICSDARVLPFADKVFDVVVSLDLLGHVPPEDKASLLAEMHRVLKDGGMALHYIETESDDPLSRFARRYPDLYSQYVLLPERHVGLEPPESVSARFRASGFIPVREQPVYKGFVYARRFLQYFDNEYKMKNRAIRLLVWFVRKLCDRHWLENIANLFLTMLFELFDPLLPDSWAGGILVWYKRTGS